MTATCAWCSAPRDTGDTCPRCGANYAKAEAIKSTGSAAAIVREPEAAAEAFESTELDQAEEAAPDEWKNVSDPEWEWKFCVAAIPAALILAVAFNATGFGSSLQRIFLTMPVHELGHAVTAWFCGFDAIPTLWKTVVFGRGMVAPLALAGALGYGVYLAHRAGKRSLVYVGCALILLQAIGTLVTGEDTARMLITFGGDGAGMILATLSMASFFVGKNTQLYKGSVRWGLLVIGAAAFVDMYATWWKARTDLNAIPFGAMGDIATDARTLVDVHEWTVQTLVNRYFLLGMCCLVALAVVYALGVRRARAEIETRHLARQKAERARRKREERATTDVYRA